MFTHMSIAAGKYKGIGNLATDSIPDSSLYDLESMGLAIAGDYGANQAGLLSPLINNSPIASGKIPLSKGANIALIAGAALLAIMMLRK